MNGFVNLPQAILFDWDGTLADSYKFLEGAHNHVRQSLGLSSFQADEFKNYFGHPREKLYVELYGDKVEQAKTLFGDYVVKNHMEHLKPMSGAKELLDAAHQLGVAMGIVSNKRAEYLHREIKGFGWDDYFQVVVGAGDAPNDKPSADPLLKAAKDCDFNVMADLWYVGDTDVDLQCAQNAGCPVIFMAHDPRSEEWIKLYKPLLIFKNCGEMTEFLLQSHGNRLQTKKL